MLAQHMHTILMFQRLAIQNGQSWDEFKQMVNQVMPKKGANLELPINTIDSSASPQLS